MIAVLIDRSTFTHKKHDYPTAYFICSVEEATYDERYDQFTAKPLRDQLARLDIGPTMLGWDIIRISATVRTDNDHIEHIIANARDIFMSHGMTVRDTRSDPPCTGFPSGNERKQCDDRSL